MAVSWTEDQVEEVAWIKDNVMAKVRVEVDAMVEMIVSKPNREFFGESEFVLRDRPHTIAGHVLDAALEERKKGVPRFGSDLSRVWWRSSFRGISTAGGTHQNRSHFVEESHGFHDVIKSAPRRLAYLKLSQQHSHARKYGKTLAIRCVPPDIDR